MASQNNQTLLIPVKLGSPTRYDRSIFPLMRFKGKTSSLHTVDLVLEATMDELIKMRHMVGNSEEFQKLIHDAKVQYDDLLEDREDLGSTKTTFNPFKLFSTYRAVRLLSEAGTALWTETKSTSERLRRQLLSVDTQDMQPVGYDDLPPDAEISAIAISTEAETYLDDTTTSFFTEAASFIGSQVNLLPDGNPFADVHEAEDVGTSAASERSSTTNPATDDDGVTSSSSSRLSSPSSPSSRLGSGNNYFFFSNSYVASRSAIHTPTLNNGGSRNRESSTSR